MTVLRLERLTREAFAPFGDVIEFDGTAPIPINNGTTQRYHHLAHVETSGGEAGISLARGDAFHYPITIAMLERHPFGSQAWIPCNHASFIAVVAPNGADDLPDESAMRAFFVRGTQGVNYHRGTWHHPLLAVGQQGHFIIVDRVGTDANCDEASLSKVYRIDGSYADGHHAMKA